MEELKFLAEFGVGGVIGGLIFFFYRQDHKQLVELHVQTTKALTENTATIAGLQAMLNSHLAEDRRGYKEAGR